MRRSLTAAALLLASTPVWAHTGTEHAAGLLAGLMHPLHGLDHLLAMVAVGLWAGSLGGARSWSGPATFVTAMLGGLLLATIGLTLPAVEPGIALSVLALGLMVAFAARVRPAHALPLIGLFALFHGYAHGAEMAGPALAYATGMLVSTGALHLGGIALARTARQRAGLALRAGGGAIAAAGGLMLAGML